MSTSTTPVMTFNGAGNLRASASLAASATFNNDVDYSTKFEAQIHIKNTPGGTVSATRGLRIDVYRRYSSGPATADSPMMIFFLPSQTISVAESLDFFLPTGKWNIKVTNLDAAQAVTVEMGDDTVSSLLNA